MLDERTRDTPPSSGRMNAKPKKMKRSIRNVVLDDAHDAAIQSRHPSPEARSNLRASFERNACGPVDFPEACRREPVDFSDVRLVVGSGFPNAQTFRQP
jgi:hypothetical protein